MMSYVHFIDRALDTANGTVISSLLEDASASAICFMKERVAGAQTPVCS